jgi:hypothetical protein
VRVLARSLTHEDVFRTECLGRGTYCVLVGGDEIEENVERLAHKYERFRFRFFGCGEKCPIVFGRKGVWIFDYGGKGVIELEMIDGIELMLDRVSSGKAVFESLDEKGFEL